jgi:PhnB protein
MPFGADDRFRMPGPDGKTIMYTDLKMGDYVFMLTEESAEMKTLLESIGRSHDSLY